MKKILMFKYPEEEIEFDMANNGHNFCIAITEILELFRQKLKYSELTPEEHVIYETIRQKILDICEDNGITRWI